MLKVIEKRKKNAGRFVAERIEIARAEVKWGLAMEGESLRKYD